MIATPSPSARRSSRSAEAGFTLTEMLVAAAVMLIAMLGLLALFDLNRSLARSQTMVADVQQAVRVAQNEMVRDVRMAGRGGLERGLFPGGIALAVRNDVPDSGDESFIAVGKNDTHTVLVGSDVVTVRGVLTTPIYQLNPSAAGLTLDDEANPTAGSVVIQNPVPNTGVAQDLQPLFDAEVNDALLLVSPLASYAVVEITGVNKLSDDQVRLSFDIGTVGGSALKDQYATLTGGFPISLRTVAHAGLLEEYRYYIRRAFRTPNDPTSGLAPKLARARFRPGSEELVGGADSWEDVADNVFDLQVALGIDTNNNEVIEETETGAGDDWLFNAADDSNDDGTLVSALWNDASLPRLYYVRLTTLARTDLEDPQFQAPLLTTVEDKNYGEDPHNAFNARGERMYRRRVLTTVVDLRNVS